MANGSTSSKNRMQNMVNKVNGGGEVTDVMGGTYTRTDTGKKVNENTYTDYAMEYGATPTKKEAKKYKRKVRKGKI